MVLHYYAQLFQIRAVPDPFHAIVVDSDALLPSLKKLSDFWNVARMANPEPLLVPRLDYFAVARDLGSTVLEALVGRDLPAAPNLHPAEAIFDSTSLNQSVKEGLYARPALSAVLQTDWSQFPLASLTGFQRVLVVGSLIGGTGGGLIAPLLSQLAMRIKAAQTIPQPDIRAVFFGEYFEIRGDSPVRDANLRYPSNKLMVARCLKDLAPPELAYFAFIEPATPRPRNLNDERSPVNLSWPAQTDAIWIGVSALEELRTDRTAPRDGFDSKERIGLPLRNLETCTTILNDRLGVARTIHKKTVFNRMTAEPWLTTFYGPQLPAMLAKATAVAKEKPALGINGIRSLAGRVQAEYGAQWNDLSSVFPLTKEKAVGPAVLRNAGWSSLNVTVPGFNSSQKALTSYTSAHILHNSLRGSETENNPVSTVPLGDAQNRLSNLLTQQNSWEAYTLFGESIPHLLHWDWAYLWIMERQSPKPKAWEDRIEAWRRLLCMLLLNELQLESVSIERPLLGYTDQLNLHKVVLVRSEEHFGQTPIGVLSPTVIIRPLPEPNRFDITASKLATKLPKHYDRLPGARDRRAELSQMLELANSRIRALAARQIQDGGSEFAPRLLNLLQTNLRITRFDPVPNDYRGEPLPYAVPLLAKADASAWSGLALTNLALDASSGGERPQFVPRCSYTGCRHTLTYAETDAAIEVSGNEIVLKCGACPQTTTFQLEDFGIWNYGSATYVWKELETFEGLSAVPLPPSPEINGDEVWFRWNVARTGDSVRVNLRLRFPGQTLQKLRPADVKYGSLLVPGEFSEVKALPIRPEWLFALNQDPMPAPEIERDVIVYRNVRFRGMKHPVTLGRYPKAACTVVPELQVGMFPKPMYTGWRRYRFFCSGPQSDQYRARLVADTLQPDVTPRKPAEVLETTDGLPQAIAVEGTTRGGLPANVGATWLLPKVTDKISVHAVHVGIDFGTTNTVVYVQVPAGEAIEMGPENRRVVIQRSDLVRAAKVIAGAGEARASFLPAQPTASKDATDPTLIPSALWFSEENASNPIRWKSDPPSRQHQAIYRLKWSSSSRTYRERYLDELLFLVLPASLNRLFPGEKAKGNWRIGFAFPLAFSGAQRQDYGFLYETLRQNVDQYTSGPVEVKNVNESFACVRALGQFREGSVLLIADLGGGSLDVALFEVEASAQGESVPKFFQVGSAKIGGESFVKTIADKMGSDEISRNEKYSTFRDAIMAGRVAEEFPGGGFDSVANRFLTIAQELLRVMVAAFQQKYPTRAVRLVLAGNGWRIAEFTANTPLAQNAAKGELARTLQQFGISDFSIYEGEVNIAPKHLVAIGALENAGPTGQSEIPGAINEVRMPSGRDVRLTNTGSEIKWSDLVGPAVADLPLGTGAAHVEITRVSGPPAPSSWQQRLDFSMPKLSSDPTDEYISGEFGFSGGRIQKGPLQIILEKWAEKLS